MFFKKTLPLTICFVFGLLGAVQFYVPGRMSNDVFTVVNEWVIIVAGFAALLGLGSLLHIHWARVRRRDRGWGYSFLVFISLALTIWAGFLSGGETAPLKDGSRPDFGWFYDFVMVPLDATMFAILAFFVASVAFRSFRFKSIESFLLLLTAIIMIFGRVPLGEAIWEAALGPEALGIGDITDWIFNVLNVAARRGILLGVALGMLATSLKIILGIERSYLGGGE